MGGRLLNVDDGTGRYGPGFPSVQRMIEQARLEEATGRIEAAQARLARVEEMVLDQRAKGHDTGLADSLLRSMRTALCLMVRHRLSIRRTLAPALGYHFQYRRPGPSLPCTGETELMLSALADLSERARSSLCQPALGTASATGECTLRHAS